MPSRAEELLSRLDAVEDEVTETEKAAKKLKDHDRSRIARLVIYLYVGVVAASFVFILGIFLIGTYWKTLCADLPATGCVAWKEPAEFLLQVLTTTVLPIVTLVLGYYFGTAKVETE